MARIQFDVRANIDPAARSPSAVRHREEMESARCVTTRAWPVVCEDFSARPDHRFVAHTHEQPHVCFVIGGTLIERDGRAHRRMPAGAGRISPAGDAHDLAVGSERPLRCLVLSFDAECLDEPRDSLPPDRRYVHGPGVAALSRRVLGELRSLDDTSPISLEMLAIEAAALAGGSPSPSVTPGWLERVRDRVRADLRSVPTLAELARDAGVSRAHLARTFRAHYGYTIGQYVRGQRLETARRLILHSDTPLASVAYAAGFADQSHMTRLVGSRFGHPPGRLRALRSA